MDGVSYANGLNWQFRCLNLLGGSNKIENRANRESEPFLESDDDYDYDEYQSVELDTANKANKAFASFGPWPSPGILRSFGVCL